MYSKMSATSQSSASHTAWNQMEQLTQYAAEQGLTNPELFYDWRFSGVNDKRPQYQRMIWAMEAGTVSNLVVLNYSRLGRDYQMCSQFIEVFLPQHGVTFHAAKDGIIYTPQALNKLSVQHKAVYTLFQQMRRERGQQ